MARHNSHKSAEDKRKFLHALIKGKASVSDIIQPVEGMLIIHNEKVVAHKTIAGTINFKEGEEPDAEEYKVTYKGKCGLEIILEDFS